jgi:hypothetical protein
MKKESRMKNLAVGLSVLLCLVLVGAWLLPAQGQDKPKAETPKAATGTVAVADIDAAAKAVAEANTALNADNKKDAQEKLDQAAKLLAKMKAAATAGASATPPAAAGASGTYTGTVESTMSQKRPRLVVGAIHYELKPSDDAEAGVKDTLAKISKGEATGKYTVKGTVSTIEGRTWLIVDSITKAAE